MKTNDEFIDNEVKLYVTHFAQHYALNDVAHRESHFSDVLHGMRLIRERTGMDLESEDEKMKDVAAAYLHDLFTWDRESHHMLAYWFVTSGEHPLLTRFDTKQRSFIARACAEHRASKNTTWSSVFSELLASADRGIPMPGDVENLLKRSMTYHAEKGESDARAAAVAHLKQKFGSKGYATYPTLYLEAFGDELQERRRIIDNL